MESLLLIKIVVSIATVLGLSLVAERVSPRVAGLLSGYPLGTAIALFFIGIENGAGFASESAVYTLPGLAAALCLSAFYFGASRLVKGRKSVALAGAVAIAGFVAVSALFALLPSDLSITVATPLAAIVIFATLFRRIENAPALRRVKLGFRVLAFRAALATVVVLAVTGSAALIGPEWAGLLSAFPSSAFPLFLVIHWTYGGPAVHTIIKNYPVGMGSLVVYSLSVALTYEPLGIGLGTLASFAFATIYLIGFSTVSLYISRRAATTAAPGD